MKALPKQTLCHLLLLGTVSVICTALSILFLDQGAAHILTPEQALKSYRVTRTLTDAGESTHFFVIAIIGAVGCWLYLKVSQRKSTNHLQKVENFRFWSMTFLYSLIASGIVTHLIKFIAGRARPNQSDDHIPWNFDFFNSHWHYHSFPSGHSQTLFTAAVAIAFAFPKLRKVTYLLAGLLAVTRILLNQHFLSDVIMGAYIGYAVTYMIFTYRSQSSIKS